MPNSFKKVGVILLLCVIESMSQMYFNHGKRKKKSNHYEKILKSGLSLLIIFLFHTASESSGHSDNNGLTTEADLQDPQTVEKINANWESRQEGSFPGVDDLKIKYVAILKDDERGAVVISNGRTESYIKYKELAYDLGQDRKSVV